MIRNSSYVPGVPYVAPPDSTSGCTLSKKLVGCMQQMSEEVSVDILSCRRPAALPAAEEADVRARISLDDRSGYFALSCCPITPEVERRLEQDSKVVSNENYGSHWAPGRYHCARCDQPLYGSEAKWAGPCMWPTFREPLAANGSCLRLIDVPRGTYNSYMCEVHELYCGKCDLFVGHQFGDGRDSGDTHPRGGQRHCVLSLSLRFFDAAS